MPKCKVWIDEKGIYVRHDNRKIRPGAPREYQHLQIKGRHVPKSQDDTEMNLGYTQVYHVGGSPMFYITQKPHQATPAAGRRKPLKTVSEVWFITNETG